MAIFTLETKRLLLVLPQPEHAAMQRVFLERNRDHFVHWDPPVSEDVYTDVYWHDQITSIHKAFADRSAIRLWMQSRDDLSTVVGSIGFSQIFRGPFCSCLMGYKIDQAYEGRGLMHEALEAAIRFMFIEQKLHRIGANYRPENIRSGKLLANLGFRIDGFSKDYLFIDGAWRDHVLTSITNDAFRPEWLG